MSLQGYVPRLARHEDFGRIFEGVGSSSAESVHACDWSKHHQGRRGAYMATPADRMHTATGWVCARATSSVVVVFTCRACGPRCSIGDSSRALETSRHAIQQKSTPMKYKAAFVIQASAGLALVSVSRQLSFFCCFFLVFFLFCSFLSYSSC